MSTVPDFQQDATLPVSPPPTWTNLPESPVPGRIGDFEIVSKLGAGSFGQVFLARQVSLGRQVALKVVRGQSAGDHGEGQLLAGLEHDHIVKVFSAFEDTATGCHGLCLQYVPGADLGLILKHLHGGGRTPESGQAVLAALDALRQGDPGFDPGAMRDRESLATDNFAQAVCRLGGRLAEALAFAHAHGILHCDIKPGNILLTPYGRPMLADFNVAFDRTRHPPEDVQYGGTLAYMAPEYHRAMLGKAGGSADERCDVYSLGVVLHELATGYRPLPVVVNQTAETVLPGTQPVKQSATSTTSGIIDPLASAPRELAAVIRRCLAADPSRRYQTAAELATALTGAWHLLAAQRALPAPSRIGRWVAAHLATALVLVGTVPHLIASVAQIEYNAVEIHLNEAQQQAFVFLVVIYNLLAYGLCGGLGIYLIWRVAKSVSRLAELSGAEVDRLRRRSCRLAWQIAAIGALGWFPGAVVFPLGIHLATGSLPWQIYSHFAVSFALAGLIGVVFSYLGIEYVVFRALLPQLGNPDSYTPAKAWAEVRPLTAPFGLVVVLACGVPLVGAVLLLTLDDGPMTFGFRLLVVKLIGLGVAGVSLAERVVRRLRQLAAVWHVEGSEGGS